MKQLKRLLYMLLFLGIIGVCFSLESYAASFSVSAPSSVQPGQSFTITITGNSATGRIDVQASNATLNSSYVWVENNSQSITATAGSEGSISITATATSLADSDTGEDMTGTRSCSVSVQQPTVEEPSSGGYTSNNRTTRKTEEEPEEKPEEEKRELGLYGLVVKGEKEDGTIVELSLDKEFEFSRHEYIIYVPNDIKKINLETESYEYNETTEIIGTENDLVPGENIITIRIIDGDNESIYTLKVIKEEMAEEIKEVEETIEETTKKEEINFFNREISFQVKYFILLVLGIVLGEAFIIILLSKLIKRKQNEKSKRMKEK